MQALEYHPALNGIAFPLKEEVCSFQVHLDLQLFLDSQMVVLAIGVFAQLWLMHQLWPYLDHADLATVSHGTVTWKLGNSNIAVIVTLEY